MLTYILWERERKRKAEEKREERRLDGGIAVTVCDHIHEACARNVQSTNGEFFSKTRS